MKKDFKGRAKKVAAILLLSLASMLFLSIGASAEERDYIGEFTAILPPKLAEAAQSGEKMSDALSTEALAELVLSSLSEHRGEIISFYALVIGAVIFSALASALFGEGGEAVSRGLSVIFTASVFSFLLPIFRSAISSLAAACDFISSGAPVMCALTLAGGGAASAAVAASGASLSVAFVSFICAKILPVVAVFGFVAGLISSFGGNRAVEKGAKGVYTKLLGFATLLITATLSLQSVIASAEDSAALRAAKYGAATVIPSVGGAVSSSLSVLIGGLSYAKGLIGAAAVGALLYIFLSPLVILLIYRTAVGIASGLAELLGAAELSSLGIFSSVLDSLIASWALSAVLLVVQVILFMKGGAAV